MADVIYLGPMVVLFLASGAYAIPALALAGRLARQGRRITTPGTVPSDTFTFTAIALSAGLLVRALCSFPIAAMGPFLEHFDLFR